MAARSPASRTTTKTNGWLFSALGAWVAAVRIRATVASSTSSGRKERAARWVSTTSKKSGMPQSPPEPSRPDQRQTDRRARCRAAGRGWWRPGRSGSNVLTPFATRRVRDAAAATTRDGPRRVMVPSADEGAGSGPIGSVGSDRTGSEPARHRLEDRAASAWAVGLGLVWSSRYLVPCAGDGPVSAMIPAVTGRRGSSTRRRGTRRQTVADGAASLEDVLKGIIGQPTGKLQGGRGAGAGEHFADAVLAPARSTTTPRRPRRPDSTPSRPLRRGPSPWSSRASSRRSSRRDAPTGNPLMAAMGPADGQGRPDPPRRAGVHLPPSHPGGRRARERGQDHRRLPEGIEGQDDDLHRQETNWTDDKTGEPVVTARFNLIHRS